MKIIPPGSIIGILGGGQLGRMTALAAAKLGYKTHIYAQSSDEPACKVTPFVTLGEFSDTARLKEFASKVDVVTLEWENVPLAALDAVASVCAVHPGANVLKTTQDRVLEKSFAKNLGLGVPEFRAVKDLDGLKAALKQIGAPAVLKTACGGYDGKGQAIIRKDSDAETAWAELKTDHAILEGFVKFSQEISVIVARRADGTMKAFTPVENRHKNGILDETHVPAHISLDVQKQAQHMAETLATKLGVIGLLAVEMFVTDNGVLMNEMAPRPHNSGHWTMDFCATSQFEQLVRAICGLSLGDTTPRQPCMMKNLIGDDAGAWEKILKEPGASLHLYGKRDAKPGRKMGHVNLPLKK